MKTQIFRFLFAVITFHLITAGSCSKNDVPAPPPSGNSVTDIEGNVYTTVQIGNQVWMAENLKTTKYRNGASIDYTNGQMAWSLLAVPKSPAYTNPDYTASNVAVYGRLYNWHAVNDSRGLAPAGWHIPSDAEWTTMIDFLGGKTVATANKLKATGTTYWKSPNNASNSSGFTALPAGTIGYDGYFLAAQNIGFYTTFWSATPAPDIVNHTVWARRIWHDGVIYGGAVYPNFGLSVRCVKD